MGYSRSTVLGIMQSWIGKKESDGSHKVIIDIYNTISPLPRGYKLQYSDAWCAGTVSAAFHKAGYDTIFPSECGCYNMIEKAKNMGIWVENDAYVPSPADCILYDWQDSGSGDNQGVPDHVGMVEKVSGSVITVIEGNYSDSVKRREIAVNGRYIRGYITPRFTSEKETTVNNNSINQKSAVKTVTAADSASSKNAKLAGTYKVTTALHLRNGAGTGKKSLFIIPEGTKVKNYGYYSTVDGVKWLYIQFTLNNVKYTGFSSEKYLKLI